MGPVEAVRTCFAKYVTFSGRARRPEYWWFVLAVALTGLAASGIDGLLFGADIKSVAEPGDFSFGILIGFSPLGSIVSLATVLPMLAAGWRRLHDRGRPGWVMFLPHAIAIGGMLAAIAIVLLVSLFAEALQSGGAQPMVNQGGPSATPSLWMILVSLTTAGAFIAMVWLFVQLVSSSQPGPNRFGPEPPVS
jgi:uncharacterized membrane protein YhaH (DUF805 family)